MAIGSGISAQIMWGVETTAGVIVTPTATNPLVEESLVVDIEMVKSDGIIAGRRVRTTDQWDLGNITAGGDIGLELYNRGLGKLLRAMFGGISTSGAGPYTHVHTPGDLSDDVLTMQVGLPGTGGTVHPKTLGGCAITAWELAFAAGEITTLGATVAAMNGHLGSRVVTDGATTDTDATVTSTTGSFGVDDIGKPISGTGIPAGATIVSITSATSVEISAVATATATGLTITIGTALATASYLSTQYPLHFDHGTISLFGTEAATVAAGSISASNALADERRFIGSRNRALPIEAGLREYTGTLETEFADLTQFDRFAAGTEGALSLVFAAGTDSVTIAGNIAYTGSTPQVSDRSILTQELPFEFVASSTDASAITCTVVNGDSAP